MTTIVNVLKVFLTLYMLLTICILMGFWRTGSLAVPPRKTSYSNLLKKIKTKHLEVCCCFDWSNFCAFRVTVDHVESKLSYFGSKYKFSDSVKELI